MSKNFGIAILGGGPAGYVAAIRASQLGFKTVVIDKDNLGGICLNWGCIPTKALLKSAEYFDFVKNHSNDYGINVENPTFDFDRIIKRSRDISERISKNVELLIKKNKVERVKGFGKLTSKNKIEIYNEKNEKVDEIVADKIIISTGARPKSFPNIPIDGKKIITSKEAMVLNKVPKDLIIIGAGAIGVEFAYFYSVLGSNVTIIEMLDNILPIEDKEISETLEKSFKKCGIKIYIKTKVINAKVENDIVKILIEKDGKQTELTSEICLSAIGVTGNIEGIGLENLGIQIEKGHIKVDKSNYQTNIQNIYAIGDVIGPPWLAHVASAEGITCVEKIKGLHVQSIDYNTIASCTYCNPQVASVGLTEAKAEELGYKIKIGKFPFMASGKAFAVGEREGFVKIIFDEKYGEILGAHIIGQDATELISEITIAKSLEATYESIVKTVHAHPTLSESIMEAAANAYGESIHI